MAANTTDFAAEMSPSDHCGLRLYNFCLVCGSPSSLCSFLASCTSTLTAAMSVVHASRILPFTSSCTPESPALLAARRLWKFILFVYFIRHKTGCNHICTKHIVTYIVENNNYSPDHVFQEVNT